MEKLRFNSLTIKIIAMISMVTEHTLRALVTINKASFASVLAYSRVQTVAFFVLPVVRSITFPLIVFSIIEDLTHTPKKNYPLWLGIFTLIAQIPFTMLFGDALLAGQRFLLNGMFASLLGSLMLLLYVRLYLSDASNEKKAKFWCIFISLLIIIVIGALISGIYIEYGISIFALVYMFYFVRNEKARRIVPIAIWGYFIFRASEHLSIQEYSLTSAGLIIAALILLIYNGEWSEKTKYLLNGFYPVQLIVIAVVINVMF